MLGGLSSKKPTKGFKQPLGNWLYIQTSGVLAKAPIFRHFSQRACSVATPLCPLPLSQLRERRRRGGCGVLMSHDKQGVHNSGPQPSQILKMDKTVAMVT